MGHWLCAGALPCGFLTSFRSGRSPSLLLETGRWLLGRRFDGLTQRCGGKGRYWRRRRPLFLSTDVHPAARLRLLSLLSLRCCTRVRRGGGVKKCGAISLSVVKYVDDDGQRNKSVQVIWMLSLCCTRRRRGAASRKAWCNAVFLWLVKYMDGGQRYPSWANKYVSREVMSH